MHRQIHSSLVRNEVCKLENPLLWSSAKNLYSRSKLLCSDLENHHHSAECHIGEDSMRVLLLQPYVRHYVKMVRFYMSYLKIVRCFERKNNGEDSKSTQCYHFHLMQDITDQVTISPGTLLACVRKQSLEHVDL